MAEYSGRRGTDALGIPKRGSRLVSRDSTKIKDQNIQYCNRIGCSGRLNTANSTRNVNLDKTKVVKPSSSRCSTSDKQMTVNPTKVVAKVATSVKPSRGLRNNSPSETASSVSRHDCSSSSSDGKEAAFATSNPSLPAVLHQRKSQIDESTMMETGSPSEGPNLRPNRNFLKKSASVAGSNLTGSKGSRRFKSASELSRPNSLTSRPGSRYLRCSSVPTAETSDSATSTRKPLLKRRSFEEESSSSSKAKQPAIDENTRNLSSRSGVSISERRQARRSQTSLMDNASPLARARRSDTSTSRRPPQLSLRESSTNQYMRRFPYLFSTTSRPHRTLNFSPNTTESSRGISSSSSSESARASNLIGFRHLNVDGIAEMLLALDQIEHDEEISFEQQLLSLESNQILNGLSFDDQHRDMRLDIDGMSYEELLVLEERMGSVSTALSEEALAKSINKSTYEASFSNMNESEDDIKCSICQEEYNAGDEMGSLHCKHSFHEECIDQWLRQKNWCPICKSSLASSSF